MAGVVSVVHSALGNVTTENKENAFLSLAGKAVATDATHKRQRVHFILKPKIN